MTSTNSGGSQVAIDYKHHACTGGAGADYIGVAQAVSAGLSAQQLVRLDLLCRQGH